MDLLGTLGSRHQIGSLRVRLETESEIAYLTKVLVLK